MAAITTLYKAHYSALNNEFIKVTKWDGKSINSLKEDARDFIQVEFVFLSKEASNVTLSFSDFLKSYKGTEYENNEVLDKHSHRIVEYVFAHLNSMHPTLAFKEMLTYSRGLIASINEEFISPRGNAFFKKAKLLAFSSKLLSANTNAAQKLISAGYTFFMAYESSVDDMAMQLAQHLKECSYDCEKFNSTNLANIAINNRSILRQAVSTFNFRLLLDSILMEINRKNKERAVIPADTMQLYKDVFVTLELTDIISLQDSDTPMNVSRFNRAFESVDAFFEYFDSYIELDEEHKDESILVVDGIFSALFIPEVMYEYDTRYINWFKEIAKYLATWVKDNEERLTLTDYWQLVDIINFLEKNRCYEESAIFRISVDSLTKFTNVKGE